MVLRNANKLFLEQANKKGINILLQKTGFIEESGKCVTVLLKKGDKIYSVVILSNKGDDNDRRISLLKIINKLK
ncbi:MAG: hypothetical protein QM532_01685 [Cyanobium sp. MAG06]|nr:hypothetical protein [Cyanobium sp. MAG06]